MDHQPKYQKPLYVYETAPALESVIECLSYAVDHPYFENDVFMYHEYCWCWKDDCPWCSGDAPNFWYKPKDIRVYWYKWVGRDMTINKKIDDWDALLILIHCLDSIRDRFVEQ